MDESSDTGVCDVEQFFMCHRCTFVTIPAVVAFVTVVLSLSP